MSDDPMVRIADALERIARALESKVFGTTAEDVRATRELLEEDLRRRDA